MSELNISLRNQMQEDGFFILRNCVATDEFQEIIQRCEGLFHGNFETKVYPDEWHFRHGLTYPDKTKEIVNAWKCDKKIAGLVLNEELGRKIASIMNWPSVRIAQDDVILKPPGGSAVGVHQDSAYISQNFRVTNPSDHGPLSVTVWIPLEPVDESNGTLLFAQGSHRWDKSDIRSTGSFHTSQGGFSAQKAFQSLFVGQHPVKIVPAILQPGDVSVHHEDIWHCSDVNASLDRHRRIIAVHLLRGDVEFALDQPTYIYGRYKLFGESNLRQEFFPTIWPRSDFVKWYLASNQNNNVHKL